MRQIVYSYFLVLILALSITTEWYDILGLALLSVLLMMILQKIGKGIVLLEVTAFLYVFTCIVMPLAGYEYYSYDNALSRLWVKYMVVSKATYFNYSLPAITCFCLAITWPSFKKQIPDEGVTLNNNITEIKGILLQNKNTGLQIMLVGVIISLVTRFLPVSLNYFAQLFFFGSFAGLLYVFYSPAFKYKKIVMLIFIGFILWNALQTGMFTIIAYMGITIFSFFQIGKRSSLLSKLLLLTATLAFFIVLQNVKLLYRTSTWRGSYEGSKVELFTNLFLENAQKGNSLLNQDGLFPLYARTNQGFNVALVMRRIPAVQPHDEGSRLMTVFASAFVPRFLWIDKPEAGGAFNMKYYTGYTILGWSTNVGPLGEAYGSFGSRGGIFYMLFLGLFLRWVYLRVFIFAVKTPLLVCWLPMLFYLIISSAETDSLQILNSIFKSAFFLWLLYKTIPQWFGVSKKVPYKRVNTNQLNTEYH